MEWDETGLPWWDDAGKLVEVDDPSGLIKGRLVVVEQTPGPDECPIFAVEANGVNQYFDPACRWRFVDA